MRRVKSILAVIVCITMIFGLLPATAVQAAAGATISVPEMVQSLSVLNSSFEEPVTDGKVLGWPTLPAAKQDVLGKVSKGEVSSSMSYSGSNSFYMKDDSATNNFIVESEKIKISPNQSYTVSAMVYLVSGTEIKIYAPNYSSSGTRIANGSKGTISAGVPIGQWTKISVSIAANANNDYIIVKMAADAGTTGEGYFDDITITRSVDTLSGKFENSNFESVPYAASSAYGITQGIIPGWTVKNGATSDFALSNDTSTSTGSSLSVTNSVYATTDIESYPIGVAPGKTYNITSSVKSTQAYGAGLSLKYYNSTGTLLSSSPVRTTEDVVGQWTNQSVKWTAPDQAAYATVSLSTTSNNLTTSYFDDITITETPTALDNNALLTDIKVDGVSINGFTSDNKVYNVELPFTTVSVPAVTVTEASTNAFTEITQASDIPGTATVKVVSEDGVTQNIYTVNFTKAAAPVIKSNNADLLDLKVDGVTVTGFTYTQKDYSYEVPYTATVVPIVTATAFSSNATVNITPTASLPGTTTVEVTAEDGITKNTYTVNFTKTAPDTNALLSDLKVGGITVNAFASDKNVYDVVLPYSATTAPEVTATAVSQTTNVAITQATVIPGAATVVVTAQDGITKNTYTVNFTKSAPPPDINISIPDMYQSLPVTNAGFEDSAAGAGPSGWSPLTSTDSLKYEVSSTMAYTGTQSLHMQKIAGGTYIAQSDKISVEPGQSYEASAMCYNTTGQLKIYLVFYNSSDAEVGKLGVAISSIGKWGKLSSSKVAPATADYALIKIGFDSSFTGEGYLDDVKLTRIVNLTTGTIENGNFERGQAGWNITRGSLSNFEISDATSSGTGKSLSITNTDVPEGVAVESYPIGVTAEENYTVSGSVYAYEKNIAGIELRFYDNKGSLLTSYPVNVADSDIGKWVNLSVTKTAPIGTAYAAIALTKAMTASAAYFDDITFKSAMVMGTFTNLGTQILNATVPAGAITKDASGNTLVAVSVNGTPIGKLAIVNANTSQLLSEIDLGGSEQSWVMMTDEDTGNIYIGGVKNGHLYRYSPSSNQVEDLGLSVAGQTHLYGLVKSTSGIIYGASYGGTTNYGKIFSYDPATTVFTDLGVVAEGEAYARALGYAPDENALYIGTGTKCKLIRYDIATGTKSTNLLPDSYSFEEYANNIDIVGDKLFISLNKTGSIIVVDKTTGEIECTIPQATKKGVKSTDGTKYYVFTQNNLAYYDIANKTLVPVVDLGANYGARTLKVVQLNTPDFPGETLVAWTGNETLFKYNFAAGNITKDIIELTGQPTEIRSIYAGPDGNIYSGGYLGGLTAYDPISGNTVYLGKTSQPEGITHYNDTLYLGLYPGARVLQYDTTKPFNTKMGNPVEIFKTPQEFYQDRPFGMVVAEDVEKLFVGSVAQYGHMQGALTTYDFKTGEWQTVTDVVYNQSIVSLTYKDGKVYGGTAIWGSLGSDPSLRQKEAKLFVLNAATGEKEHEIVPVPGASIITGLTVGPDGKIWGVAEGYLFIFDPDTMTVTYSAQIISVKYTAETWKDANLSVATDGNVYGTTNGNFFKVNATTKKITILDKANGYNYMVQDAMGNFYFRSATKSDLIKYTDENLIVKLIAAQLNAPGSVTDGNTAKLNIAGTFEKGRTTKGLERGNVQYTYSNPGIISITNGVITPTALGETKVYATVTLDNVTVQTNEITIKVVASNDAYLSDLKIDGVTVSGFTYNQYSYTVELPYTATAVPEVTVTADSDKANANIIPATNLPGTTIVEVTAEDGITKNSYTVNFIKAAPDTNAYLSDLKIDGVTVTGFTYNKNDYNVELPYSATLVPEVTVTKESAVANVNIIPASTLPGTTTVEVTAEDGITKLTYTVNFTKATAPTGNSNGGNPVIPSPVPDNNDVNGAIDDYKNAKPEDKANLLEKALDTIERAMDKASTIEEKFIERVESDTGVSVTLKKDAIESIIAKLAETKQSIEAALKDSGLESQVNLDKKEIKLEVKDALKQEMKITLPVESVKALEAQGMNLILDGDKVAFKVPANALSLGSASGNVELTARRVGDSETAKSTDLNRAGDVLDFNLSLNDGTSTSKIEGFKENVIVTLPYNSTGVNEDKLGVYRFNPVTNTWDYLGGKINKQNKTIEFATPHFSIYSVMEFSKTFSDISGHWAKNDIEVMAAKHILKGKDEVNFAPEDKLTRAEFAAIIVRALGLDTVKFNSSFNDVSAGQWYADIVQTAANAGIIKGDGNNFRPEDTITREEMTALMIRAYKLSTGKNPVSGDISKFLDKSKISSWAEEDVKSAYGLGLIQGTGDGNFSPELNATRAEAAAIVKRLLGTLQ